MAGLVKQITSWSYSRLQTYEQCPLKAKFSYIDKIPYERGPAQIRGSEIHKMGEDFVMGKSRSLKPELKNYAEEFKVAKSATKDKEAEVFVEQQWGLRQDWEPTSWFGKDTWCRVIVDLGIYHDGHIKLVDHKTGKPYANHKEQLELYAIAGFHKFPDAITANGEMWYLDQPQSEVPRLNVEFDRADLPKLEKHWANRAKPLLADKRFAPRPGGHCRWCDYSKGKGGPCKY